MLGWQKHVARDIQAMGVPASHASILQEPYVNAVGEALQDAIDRGLAGLSKSSEPNS
jgi:hypothetical protein